LPGMLAATVALAVAEFVNVIIDYAYEDQIAVEKRMASIAEEIVDELQASNWSLGELSNNGAASKKFAELLKVLGEGYALEISDKIWVNEKMGESQALEINEETKRLLSQVRAQ